MNTLNSEGWPKNEIIIDDSSVLTVAVSGDSIN